MRTFLQKQKPTHAAQSTSSMRSSWAFARQSREVKSILQLPRKCNAAPEENPLTPAPEVEAAIHKEQGAGRALKENVREPMQRLLGADFSRVRIHADSTADRLSDRLGARAFTAGNDIFFRNNEYEPDTQRGNKLLAHELIHVVQQAGGGRSDGIRQPHAPAIQRFVEVRPPGTGQASAYDRRQQIIDRLNRVSRGMVYSYRPDGPDRARLQCAVVNGAALTDFDRQMQVFIGPGQVVPMLLITSAGLVGGAGNLGPVFLDFFDSGHVDLDDLLANDDACFQTDLIHLLTERFQVPNYERLIGTNALGGYFEPAHRAAKDAEARVYQDWFRDPTIRWIYEDTRPNGTWVSMFRSNEGYRVFQVARNSERLTVGGTTYVQTADGRRVTVDAFRAERARIPPAP